MVHEWCSMALHYVCHNFILLLKQNGNMELMVNSGLIRWRLCSKLITKSQCLSWGFLYVWENVDFVRVAPPVIKSIFWFNKPSYRPYMGHIWHSFSPHYYHIIALVRVIVSLNCKCWRFVWKDLIPSLVTLRELSRCILTWSTNARGWLWSHCGSAWLYCFNSPVVHYCYTTLWASLKGLYYVG